jgi:enoyl-CoA hydratase
MGGGTNAYEMVRRGFELSERILSFSTPVVVACTGHAIAMGVFLVLSGDYRVGADGAYKIGANEVAIARHDAVLRRRDLPGSGSRLRTSIAL